MKLINKLFEPEKINNIAYFKGGAEKTGGGSYDKNGVCFDYGSDCKVTHSKTSWTIKYCEISEC